ncbi:MAG: hypothetical protein HDT28_00555 [Clostridiales bacterium]|nr:hypothetical protein [Clostridiales bacterium]
MTKRQAREMENSRQFVAELVNEFISNIELESLSIETQAGAFSLRKRENVRKVGFDTGAKNEQ